MQTEDQIEIRLHGDNITPTSFRAKEVGDLLKNLELAIKSYVISENPEAIESDIYISPTSIKNESLGISFTPHAKVLTLNAFMAIATAVYTGNYSSLPDNSIKNLKEIQGLMKSKSCSMEFKKDGKQIADLKPDADIQAEKNTFKYETIVYGEIQRVGGQVPKAMVDLDTGSRIYIELSREDAKTISHRLYETIGFRGIATYSRDKKQIVDFSATGVIASFKPNSPKEGFMEIKSIIGKYWDQIDDINEELAN